MVSLFTPEGSFNPAGFGLPFLAQLYSRNPEGFPGDTFLQQCGSLVNEGILEYARQASMQPLQPQNPKNNNSATFASLAFKAQTTTNDGKFTVNIPLWAGVKPEDLKISVKDRELIVEIKSENLADDGSTRLYQELTKKINLPEDVMADKLKTILAPEGILKIEAPLPQSGPKAVEIPVKMDFD